METTATRINQTAASPPYRIHHCSRCNGDSFRILTGHGYVNAIVCENCDSLQIDYGMVRRSASTVQPADPMRRHTGIHESDGPAANHDYDVVSDRGEARHGTTSEVHTGYDEHDRYHHASLGACSVISRVNGYLDGRSHESGTVTIAVLQEYLSHIAKDWTG